MRRTRRRDGSAERRVRSALHRAGLRYRVDYPIRANSRPVRPDVVFPRQRLALFIDGCFWHRCPEHWSPPKRNTEYWLPKIARNVERDRETNRSLKAAGWVVLRIWEHEDPEAVAAHVRATLKDRSADQPRP